MINCGYSWWYELPGAVRLIEEVAYGDPSVAWAVVNSSGAASLVAQLPEAVAREAFMKADAFYGFGLPPTGRAEVSDGGFRVSGRWPVVSGSLDASWFVLHCVVHEHGRPRSQGELTEARFFLVPAADVVVETTWPGVVAVRGSGSNAVRVDGVDVAADRTMTLGGSSSTRGIDRIPAFAFQSLTLAAVAVGIGRAARDAAIAQAGSRVSVVSRTGWSSWPAVQNTVAAADIAIESARHAVLKIADRCEAELAEGELSDATHARAHSVADHSYRTVRHAVSDLFTVGSIDALHAGHRLEQSLRDVHGFSVQWERYRRFQYLAGAALMGLEVTDPTY